MARTDAAAVVDLGCCKVLEGIQKQTKDLDVMGSEQKLTIEIGLFNQIVVGDGQKTL
jgi:hypothetical protein